MGAHGTLEQALANVSAFHDAADQLDSPPDKPHKSSKRKRKDKSKDKHRKKSKKSKHKRKHASSDSSSSDDGSDDEALTTSELLARGKQACETLRGILIAYPSARAELREVLRRIDKGESVDIRGIPDKALLTAINTLFHNLCLRRTSKGLYASSPHHQSTLGFLAHVFEEDLSHLPPPPMPAASPSSPRPPQSPSKGERDNQPADDVAACDDAPHAVNGGHDPSLMVPAAEDAQRAQHGIGPHMPPDWQPPTHGAAPGNGADDGAQGVDEVKEEDQFNEVKDKAGAPGIHRRVVGPAMPSASDLAAAAALPTPQDDNDDDDDDDLIGPPPPEFLLDVPAGSSVTAEQASEVSRVLQLLAEARSTHPPPPPGEQPLVDPYSVLGVDRETTRADVKKRYWRLSLLIHPDKCDHPKAGVAFQAVGLAAKQLQDDGLRSAADARLEQQRLDALTKRFMEQEERARQWRVAKGEATAEDLKGPAGPATRESWMTDLPIARSGAAQPPKGNVTRFSLKARPEQGDAAGWTAVPGQQQGPLAIQAAGPAALTGGETTATPAVQQAVAAFNQAGRRKTLVEQHQERLKKKKQKQAGSTVAGPSSEASKGDWEGSHPWRPFDREKDLQQGPTKGAAKDVLKRAGNLSSRFASGGG